MPSIDPIILISWEAESVRGRDEEFPVDLRDRIIEITYTDKARGADECTVKLANEDLSLFDDPRVAEGNKLIVQWGYPHDMGPRREVRITDIKGWSVLEFKCASSRELDFISVERARTWENATVTEVAEEVARELGFTSAESRDINEGDFSVRYEGISQTGETDYAFLQRLASSEDMVFRVVGNTFHFHPPQLGDQPQITLTYFDDRTGVFIGEPTIEKGTLGIPGQVSRQGHSTRDREATEGSGSNNTDTSRISLGDVISVRDPDTRQWASRQATRADVERIRSQTSSGPSSASSNQQAETAARSNFRGTERRAIELSANIIGMPNLRADTTIRVEGVGQTISGNYYVNEVAHKVGNGFECGLKLKRNAQGRSSGQRQTGRNTREAVNQRFIRDLNTLNQQLSDDEISPEVYTRRLSALNQRRDRELASAQGDAGGNVNNSESPDQNQLVAQSYRDPETRQWRTRYVRPSDSASSGSRTGGSGAGQ